MNNSFALWSYRAAFTFILAAISLGNLLPIDIRPSQIPAPDIAFCAIAAWMLRRSDYTPVIVITAVTFLTEIVLFHPLGLWTALVLLAAEFLRRNAERIRYHSFLTECAHFAVLYLVMSIGYHLVLVISFAHPPDFGDVLPQVLITVALYPLVVLATVYIFRVRKPSSTEVGILRAGF